MRPRGTPTLVVLLVVLATGAALAAASGYHVSSEEAIDVPERTVEVQRQTHTIDSMVRAEAGDRVTVSVDAPEEVYRLHIRNSEERIEASKRGDGSGTFTYDLTGYEPGSYAVTPYADGVYQDVLPLLVSGYDVTVDAPSAVDRGDRFEVALDVTRVDTAVPPEPATVQVVLATGSETRTVEATATGSGYVATVDASQLDAGEYSLYGIAQGEEEAFGRQELLGQSDGHTLAVRDSSGGETTTDGGDGGQGTAPDTDAPPPTTMTTDTSPSTASQPTGTAAATDPPTRSTVSDTATPRSSPGTPEEGATRSTTRPATAADSGGSAITPRTRAGTATAETPGGATPGFTVFGTAVAVLVGLFLLGRR